MAERLTPLAVGINRYGRGGLGALRSLALQSKPVFEL
jgi:hypothetical protein